MSTGTDDHDKDDRLPLRWGVILLGALGAGIAAGFAGGPLTGWATGLATTALLYQILGP
ncbi:MAG TPA: hypothetical protein VGX25_33055 [Actinophytocola sp.]|uniref:hypothetical protein n=1 Tax=Actinophytocola sp. TaxID=1872138 RepID=UPI002DDD6505|nr:hypothetical protein [Actinophytocola sp.]HEV2784240.1 hypothetical protein [Actinophytocola sp.]